MLDYPKDHPIIQQIQQSEYLPRMPKYFGDALSMLLTPLEFDMNECIDRLYDIPGMETVLVRVINHISQFNRKITNLKDAILYLGAYNVRMISIAHMTRLLLPESCGRTKLFDSRKYWQHCVGTSIASYMIAEKTGQCDKEKIFTYGLIHDIGITVLDICLPQHLDEIYAKQVENGVHQTVAEKVVLNGITHAEIGMWLCEHWGLPEEICVIVGYHHSPFPYGRINNDINVMYLADAISTNYYENLLGTSTTFIYTDHVREKLNLSKEYVRTIADRLPDEVEKVIRNEFFLI